MRLILLLAIVLPAFSFATQTKKVSLPKELQGEMIPYFFASKMDGNDIYREDLKKMLKPGTKRIVLSFFTTWCTICKENFVAMRKNAAELEKNGVQVYLINIGTDDFHKIEKVVKEFAGNAFPFYNKKREDFLAKDFGLEIFYPTKIILDRDLRVLAVLTGKLGDDFPEVFWGKF
ncbi:MAG: TlpA family protein disulfide reductase [Fibromonadales bacterium]|nr:TlpA family protein disulfide reductase [Fibromonadales bacterium]